VSVQPAGWALLSASIGGLPDDLARSVIGRVLVTLGDLDYRPRGASLDRLLAHLRSARTARTLGGCRIVPHSDGWLVAREPASLPPAVPFAGGTARWDRFVATLPPDVSPSGLSLGPLGRARPPGVEQAPAPARPGIPALADLDGTLAVPHFGWVRPGADRRLCEVSLRAAPRQGLAQALFAVA
jgi:tRNA(Ile)-lysidine synthase